MFDEIAGEIDVQEIGPCRPDIHTRVEVAEEGAGKRTQLIGICLIGIDCNR